MMSKRTERVTELIAHEAARFIAEAASGQSLITVTRAEAAGKGEHVTVFVSVFPAEHAGAALAFLSRQREEFSNHLKAHARIAPLPRVDFALEAGQGGGT